MSRRASCRRLVTVKEWQASYRTVLGPMGDPELHLIAQGTPNGSWPWIPPLDASASPDRRYPRRYYTRTHSRHSYAYRMEAYTGTRTPRHYAMGRGRIICVGGDGQDLPEGLISGVRGGARGAASFGPKSDKQEPGPTEPFNLYRITHDRFNSLSDHFTVKSQRLAGLSSKKCQILRSSWRRDTSGRKDGCS